MHTALGDLKPWLNYTLGQIRLTPHRRIGTQNAPVKLCPSGMIGITASSEQQCGSRILTRQQ